MGNGTNFKKPCVYSVENGKSKRPPEGALRQNEWPILRDMLGGGGWKINNGKRRIKEKQRKLHCGEKGGGQFMERTHDPSHAKKLAGGKKAERQGNNKGEHEFWENLMAKNYWYGKESVGISLGNRRKGSKNRSVFKT